MKDNWHIGRHWPSVYASRSRSIPTLEEECPCPIEPCGLVALDQVDPECPQHGRGENTIRASHSPEDCPGSPRDLPDPL